ncbi:MAG: Flagellar hook protein FlgE [Candidatus Tokpelaia hoelldobleri]|uniref:Flagellar hook protein FlgE n=1 Tax=Candidatus Tokpelaia hoelldobleri TaxID=1902579 RepID=A0A1U9JSW8_9HYPH|nr:MAG: Flagellar hook protein FlgE [Candidatus Tokpelaia hoelldoblerii]
MGITGMMRTSVSGMNAQGNRLSAVADNVANASTAGYKRASVQFSTLVVPTGASSYESGGVNSHIGYEISKQGVSRNTGLPTDVMINGGGFFRVSDNPSGSPEYLTRAGSFTSNNEGYIQNAAGYYLLDNSGKPLRVELVGVGLAAAKPTQSVDMRANLRADAMIIDKAFNPKDETTFNHKKSVTVYGRQGETINVDWYYTKTAQNTWEMRAFVGDMPMGTQEDAPAGTVVELKFDQDGNLEEPAANPLFQISGKNEPFPVEIKLYGDEFLPDPADPANRIPKPNISQIGAQDVFALDQSGGVPVGKFDGFTFSRDGVLEVSYSNGLTNKQGFVGLASVIAPERLTVINGTAFQSNSESGPYITPSIAGVEGSGAATLFGYLETGVLEESNADIGNELTDMIEAQRNYTANSKVFQTGSEVMDVIVNLKR